MPDYYVFYRSWPAFTDQFPIQDVNHLSDERLWPELTRRAEEWLRCAPVLSEQDKDRLVTCNALLEQGAYAGAPAPAYHDFFRVAVLAGWCTPKRSWWVEVSTKYGILVTERVPFLKVDSGELASYVAVTLDSEFRGRVDQAMAATSLLFGRAPSKEVPDEAYIKLCPQFAHTAADDFGDSEAQISIDKHIAQTKRLPHDTMADIAERALRNVRAVLSQAPKVRPTTSEPSEFSREGKAILATLDNLARDHAELRQAITARDGKTADEDSDPIEDCLSGQPLSIYLFLRPRKRWTSYNTLSQQDDFWRKPNPEDTAIERALRRLRQELTEIEASAVSLMIDTKHRRTKLDK